MPISNAGLDILIVEDNPADLYLIESMLASSRLRIEKIHSTDNVKDACSLLCNGNISIILLDLSLPDSYGINTLLSIRNVSVTTPIVVLTGLSDLAFALASIKEGAQDYLVKGEFNAILLAKSIQYSLERARSLEKLQESNERFSIVARCTNDAIWDWNIPADEFLVNGDNFFKMFGHAVIDAVAPNDFWSANLHPDDKDRVENKLYGFIEKGNATVWEDEYRFKKADGSFAYVHDRGYLICKVNNGVQKPVRMIGSMQDISARKKAEKAIIASEEKYRQLFYQSPLSTMIADLETLKILEVNDAAKENYGYDHAEFLCLRLKDIFPKEDVPELLRYISQGDISTVKTPKIWRHKKKNNEVIMAEVTSCYIDYLGRPAVQVQVNDITEKLRLETELLQQHKLKQQYITEAVLIGQENERSFIGRELHDNISQILSIAKIYLDMALKKPETRDELLAKSIETIAIGIAETRKLATKLISDSVDDLGIIEAIEEMIHSITLLKEINISLDAIGFDDTRLSEKQKLTIYRIFQEQFNNIMRHAEAREVNVNMYTTDEQVHLWISDNGRGFDPSVSHKGVGITNMVSRAEIYNGRVDIHSSPGKGCSIKVMMLIKEQE